MSKVYDLEVLFSRKNKECVIPSKRNEDAGYDLYVDPVWLRDEHFDCLIIQPHETVMIPTGIRSVIPKDYYAQIEERGSTGVKAMKFGAGVIDSGYRGVWNIVITNCNNKRVAISGKGMEVNLAGVIDYPATKGLAQFVLLEVPKAKITEVSYEEIMTTTSDRGEGKLGASGK